MPVDKPYITLSGTQAKDTIITWDDGDDIHDSATVSVFASNFVGRYLTFEVSVFPSLNKYFQFFIHKFLRFK